MKYFSIFFTILLSVSVIHAYALLVPYTAEDLAKLSKYIIIGKVIDIKPTIPDEKAIQLDNLSVFLYDVSIKVEDELKDQYTDDTIKFRIMSDRNIGFLSKSIEDSQKFQIGERVLVFLADKEPESVWGDSYYVAGVTMGKYVLVDGMAYGTDYANGINISELLVKIQKSIFQYQHTDVTVTKQISPLKQLKSGTPTQNVQCNEGLQL
ncbi:MAG: hypothetical protein HZA84_01010, partial [Thaumarchaeota archaeon]|nr:hypothetical protein [Nitrososphaerota archaeon]